MTLHATSLQEMQRLPIQVWQGHTVSGICFLYSDVTYMASFANVNLWIQDSCCGAHDYFCISAIKMQKEGGKGPRALSLRLPPWSCTHHFHFFNMGQKWITRPLLATRWFSFWVVMSLSLGTLETDLEIRENYFSKSALRKNKNVLRKEWNRCRGVGNWDKKRRSGKRVRVNRASVLQTGPEAV